MAHIEFYIGDDEKFIAVLDDAAVPRSGEYINIRNTAYQVERVTWAVDHADERLARQLRANVVLSAVA